MRTRGGGAKSRKFCGRHIWTLPNRVVSSALVLLIFKSSTRAPRRFRWVSYRDFWRFICPVAFADLQFLLIDLNKQLVRAWRSYTRTIFFILFLYLLSMEGKTPERYSYAPTLPGPKQTLTHYRTFHILVNDGQWDWF